jgi:hypothetical protein
MKTSLWMVLVIVVAWISFLIGYGVSALTGVGQPAADVTAAGGGYGAARTGPGAAAGGYGAPAGKSGGSRSRRGIAEDSSD